MAYFDRRDRHKNCADRDSFRMNYDKEDKFANPPPADSHFKKPFTPKKVYKNVLPDRTSLSPANYDVYLDGFPVNNPPVCLKDVPWAEYQKNPSIIDEYLRPFKVFGIAKYGPSKRFTGLDKGHIVIQFFYPESATNFLNTIRNKVCYGSVLTGMFFGEINPQDKGDYGYHGTTPFMGGLTKSKESNGNSRFFASDETTRKVVSDDNNGQSVKINVDFKKQQNGYQTRSSRDGGYSDERNTTTTSKPRTYSTRGGRGVRRGYGGPTRPDNRHERVSHETHRRKEDRRKYVNDARSKPSDNLPINKAETKMSVDGVPAITQDTIQKVQSVIQHVFTSETPKKTGTPLRRHLNEVPKDILQDTEEEDTFKMDHDHTENDDDEDGTLEPNEGYGSFDHSPEKITEEVPVPE